MNDIEIVLEDLDTLVEIARQHTGIASWLGLVQSALIMKEALEKQQEFNEYMKYMKQLAEDETKPLEDRQFAEKFAICFEDFL